MDDGESAVLIADVDSQIEERKTIGQSIGSDIRRSEPKVQIVNDSEFSSPPRNNESVISQAKALNDVSISSINIVSERD